MTHHNGINRLLTFSLICALVALFLTGPFIGNGIKVVQLAIPLIAILWFFMISCMVQSTVPRQTILYMILLTYFTVDLFYSLIVGNDHANAIRSVAPFMAFGIAGLSVSVVSNKDHRLLITGMLIYGILVGLTVIPFFFQSGMGQITTARFTAYSENSHTPILLVALPLTFALVKQRIYQFFIITLLLLAVLLTKSKGQILVGIIVLGASMTCLGKFRFSKKKFFYGFLAVVFFGLMIFVGSKKNGGFSRLDLDHWMGATTFHRIAEIETGLSDFMTSPILGAGAGHLFDLYSPVSDSWEIQNYIHNIIVYMLAKHGVLGFIIFFLPVLRSLSLAKYHERFGRAAAIGIISIISYGLVSASFKSFQANIFLGILSAVILVRPRCRFGC